MTYQGQFQAGDVLQASDLNSFRAITVLQDSLTVPNSTFTIMAFGSGTEIIDVGGWHDTSTNNTRITPNIAGVYRLTGYLDSASGGADYIVFRARKNGSAQSGAAQYSGTNIIADTNIDLIVEANGTSDYFEVQSYQTGASSTTFTCQFALELLVAT